MGRLADAILERRLLMPELGDRATYEEQCAWRDTIPGIKERISRYPIIVADNVCEYYYAQNTKDVWDLQTDFPSLGPPFESVFIEMYRPSCIRTDDKVLSSNMLPKRWGWLFDSIDVCQETTDKLREAMEAGIARERKRLELLVTAYRNEIDIAKIREAGRSGSDEELNPTEKQILDCARRLKVAKREGVEGLTKSCREADLRWNVEGGLFVEYEDPVGPFAAVSFSVTRQGVMLSRPTWSALGISTATDARETMEMWSMIENLLKPALLTLSFLNCKNVTTKIEKPEPRLNAARIRRGKKPFLKYHVLQIEPLKKILRTEGQAETQGLKRALHICRGHFATYDEKPLFGRVRGTFWIPSHVRGSREQGTVMKDYHVSPGGQR